MVIEIDGMEPEDWEPDWPEGDPPEEEPMSPERRRAWVLFWFDELYPDGTPIPPHKYQIN
jgi:hypothetical protein